MKKLLTEWRKYLKEVKDIKCKLGPWPNGMMTGAYSYSDHLVIFIKSWEGGKEHLKKGRYHAYKDSKGVWTIGHGSTKIGGAPVKKGDKITKEQAYEEMIKYLDVVLFGFNEYIKRGVRPFKQHEVDAFISFGFNVGRSKMLNSCFYTFATRDPDNEILEDALHQYGGSEGARRRRRAEWIMYSGRGYPYSEDRAFK